MKVLVINQCSTNKGDRAVLFFVLRELRRCGVDQITVSASNPQYWEDKPDFPDAAVRVIPWGWDISRRRSVGFLGKVIHRTRKIILPRRIHFPLVRNALIAGRRPWYLRFLVNRAYLRAIKRADLVLSTGGHRLTTINARDAVGPQTFDMAVALFYHKPLILWSQSIGTFDFKSSKSKPMVQEILSRAEQILIRDEASAEEIRQVGVSLEHVSKTRESVFGLYDVVKSRTRPSSRPDVMGVSVWTGNKQNLQAWENYTRCFAALVDHAIEAGYKVRFFPMEMQGSDRPCIEDVIDNVDKKENCEIVEGYPGTVDHINAIAKCKLFVGHKTHSQIFSLVAATPLLAVAYHKKTEDFMAQFGLEKYCIVDTQFNADKMIKVFNQISNNLDIISQKQEQTAFKMSEQVKKDFARMIKEFHVCR
ncbi:MAG: polysaccharide pyruvyl transferase family protein [Planctomycetota bacterium]|jgi:polysaccharide pyruvyl transferase WcaK-like protein